MHMYRSLFLPRIAPKHIAQPLKMSQAPQGRLLVRWSEDPEQPDPEPEQPEQSDPGPEQSDPFVVVE